MREFSFFFSTFRVQRLTKLLISLRVHHFDVQLMLEFSHQRELDIIVNEVNVYDIYIEKSNLWESHSGEIVLSNFLTFCSIEKVEIEFRFEL